MDMLICAIHAALEADRRVGGIVEVALLLVALSSKRSGISVGNSYA